jgi:hypothetical protein
VFVVTADKSTDLVRITYSGRVLAEEASRCAEEVRARLVEMPQGFSLLTDLSSLESMDLDCVPAIESIMDACNKRGVNTLVRVIPHPEKDIGFGIMSLFHYRRGVRTVTCLSVAEAETVLQSDSHGRRHSSGE